MRRIISVFTALLMILSLAACGKAKEDPFLGKWTATGYNIGGTQVTAADFGESTLTATSDGKCVLISDGDTFNGTWKRNNNDVELTIDDKGNPMTGKGTIDSDKITFKFTEGGKDIMEMSVVKGDGPAKSSSSQNAASSKQSQTAAAKSASAETTANAAGAASGSAQTQTYDESFWTGDWYGFLEISDATGKSENLNGTQYDASGKIEKLSDGNIRFTVDFMGDDADPENPLMLMNVDLQPDHLEPVIGEQDAWFNNIYLTKDDEFDFYVYPYSDGEIYFSHKYVDPDNSENSFDVNCTLRKQGQLWKDDEPLPPGYEAYKASL